MTVRNYHIRQVFAVNLRQLRKKAGLSQQVAAKLIGLKQNTWSQYESVKSFPEENVIDKIADILECAREDLFKRDETHELAILESTFGKPGEQNPYGITDKDVLTYLKQLEQTKRIEPLVANKIREYLVILYKELSDHKDLIIKEKVKSEEFREMVKNQIE